MTRVCGVRHRGPETPGRLSCRQLRHHRTVTAHGFALIPTMVFLLAVALIGSAVTQWVLLSARSLTNDRQHQIAYRAARAAIDDAVHDMLDTTHSPAERIALLHAASPAPGWPDAGCGSGPLRGLCAPDVSSGTSADTPANAIGAGSRTAPFGAMDWQDMQGNVPFGLFTGARYPTGTGLQPAAPPRYRIERLPAPLQAQATEPATLYRVTALGIGPLPARIPVLLQAEFAVLSPEASSPSSSTQVRELAFHQLPPPRLNADE